MTDAVEMSSPHGQKKKAREDLAREEHCRPENNMLMTSDDLSDRFGEGIEAYFHYCRTLIITNSVTMVLQVICYVVYASQEGPRWSKKYWYNDFFISSFKSDKHYTLWIAINIACVIISAITLPAVLYQRHKSDEEHAQENGAQVDETVLRDVIVRYRDDGTIDVSSHFRSKTSKVLRITFSVLFFCTLLLVQVLVSYYATKLEETSTNATMAFVIALVVAVLNLVYGIFADMLTELEKPSTMRVFKVSNTFKLLLFKLCNVITVYAAKNFATVRECSYDVIGQQFLYILIVDITLMNFLELYLPHVTSKWRRWMADRDKNDLQSDQDLLPPFDVSYEYLDTIYRQYILYMAMTVFPCAAALSWVGQILEYWLDKLKLFKFAGKPKIIEYSVKSQGVSIMVFQFIALMAALFTPYAGVVWIFSKNTQTATALKCTFP